MAKRLCVNASLLFACLASVLAAEGLSAKYRSWDQSPQAYFLTSDERAEWKQLKTDDAAEKFVTTYLARRGPGFPAMLAERIAVTDKYFTAGKTRGSETLRGKVIILFGPPTKIDLSKPHAAGNVPVGEGEMVYAGNGGGESPLNNVGPGAAGLSVSAAQERTFSVTYDEKTAPKAIGKAFKVALRMKSGEIQVPADAKDLDAKIEAVAQGSIVK